MSFECFVEEKGGAEYMKGQDSRRGLFGGHLGLILGQEIAKKN